MKAAAEIYPRATDEQLRHLAVSEHRVLLTEDKDFGHLVYARAKPSAGIVLIRFPTTARRRLAETVLELVGQRGAELSESFAVLTPARVRISRLPDEPAGSRWNEEQAVWQTRLSRFRQLQADIASCVECITRWKGKVTRPLAVGEIPDPPAEVDVLFVGVAPTAEQGHSRGEHFYSANCDNLRSGLFRLLREPRFELLLDNLGLTEGNRLFHEARCFFVHAAKVRPVAEKRPDAETIAFCATRHLAKEIEILRPRAICFLGATSLPKATQALFGRRAAVEPRVEHCGGWTGFVALVDQPVRGWEDKTRATLGELWKGRRRDQR